MDLMPKVGPREAVVILLIKSHYLSLRYIVKWYHQAVGCVIILCKGKSILQKRLSRSIDKSLEWKHSLYLQKEFFCCSS